MEEDISMKKWKNPKSTYIRRTAGFVLAAFLCIGIIAKLPFMTSAADKLDLESACSLTTLAASVSDPVLAKDLKNAKILIDIYKIADAKSRLTGDDYTFEVCDPFGGLVEIPKNDDTEGWNRISGAAASVVRAYHEAGTPIEPYKTANAGESMKGLSAGLYLVLARGEGIEDYFTENENKDILTTACGIEYEYTFAPEFVALPTKDPDPLTGQIDLTADTPWLYSAEIFMKPSYEPRFGDLRIVKGVITYENSEPAYCIFSVDAVKQYGDVTKKVFSNVYTLMFTEAEESYLIVKDIPVGSVVTVTEVYSGAAYDLVTEPVQTATIVAGEVVDVAFDNSFAGSKRRGGVITNHFDPVLDENGNVVLDENGMPTYTWTRIGDSTEEETE